MYNVTIEGILSFRTKRHASARLMYFIYHRLFPCMEILIDYDGIICD